MNKKSIALSGMRGSGKTTVGKALATKLGWEYSDVDQFIENQEGKMIQEIVATQGWDQFRTLEKEAIKTLSTQENIILGLGGGALMDEENYRELTELIIIFLECDISVCAQRIAQCTNRPSLTGDTDFISELQDIWESRKQLYLTRNDIIINNSHNDVSKTVDAIMRKITPLLTR